MSASVSGRLVQREFDELVSIVGADAVAAGDAIEERYEHDESLTVTPSRPKAVVRPAHVAEIAELARWTERRRVPLVARGAGTGLAGGAVCRPTEVCVSTERLRGVVDVDPVSKVAIVQAGTSLAELDEVLAGEGLRYTVSPGENAASMGGTVATNAGGMRAVRFGTTRQSLLGARVVTGGGEITSHRVVSIHSLASLSLPPQAPPRRAAGALEENWHRAAFRSCWR